MTKVKKHAGKNTQYKIKTKKVFARVVKKCG